MLLQLRKKGFDLFLVFRDVVDHERVTEPHVSAVGRVIPCNGETIN